MGEQIDGLVRAFYHTTSLSVEASSRAGIFLARGWCIKFVFILPCFILQSYVPMCDCVCAPQCE